MPPSSYRYLTVSRIPDSPPGKATGTRTIGDDDRGVNPYIYLLTLRKAPENRITVTFAQEIIRALREIEAEIAAAGEQYGKKGLGIGGALIVRGEGEKFWSTVRVFN